MTEELIRICVMGQQNSGKSAFVYRFIHDKFLTLDDPTLEDRYNKEFLTDDKQIVKLRVLDTGGADSTYESLSKKWIEEAAAFILLFNVCSKNSFERVKEILKDIENNKSKANTPKVIVGSQIDRDKERQINQKEAQSFAEKNSCEYLECSARTGDGVNQVFHLCLKRIRQPPTPTSQRKGALSPKLPRKGSSSSMRSRSSLGPRDIEELEWNSRKPEARKWEDLENKNPAFPELIATENAINQHFTFEFGKADIPYENTSVVLEDEADDVPYYKNLFYGKDHINFVGESESNGTVIISSESPAKNTPRKTIIRTKKGNERLLIPPSHSASKKDIIKYIQSQRSDLADVKNFIKVLDPETQNDLLNYEKKEIVNRYKFGVLYYKDGQDENGMFSNASHSRDMDNFLDFLGNRVELKGFTGYAGGLDTKTNTTGHFSVYTQHRNCEIMFHVSTLLPFQEDDPQRVERKRHLGNDIVLIIFKEGDIPFDPTVIKSHFNHIFCVVQVHQKFPENRIQYRVSIANKAGVQPYSPYLPNPPILENDEKSKDFLLTKLINGERWCLKGGEFRGTNIRTRKETLEQVVKAITNRPKDKKKQKSVVRPASPSPPSSPKFERPLSPQITRARSSSGGPAPMTRGNSAPQLKISQSEIFKSASSPKEFNQEKINKIIACARALASGSQQSPENFKSAQFRNQLYQLVANTVATFTGTDSELEAIIEQAKSLSETGSNIIELQEKRQSSENESLQAQWKSIQNEFGEKLVKFIQMINQTVKTSDEAERRVTHTSLKSYPLPTVIERPAEAVGKTTLEIAGLLSKSEFDSEQFGKGMRSIYDAVKQISRETDPETSKELMDAIKPLLQKAVLLKNESANFENRKSFIGELTKLCSLLKEHTAN